MTIRRGEAWGTTAPLPPGVPVAASNGQLRAAVTHQQTARQVDGSEPQPIGVTGGDLWRVVGAPAGGLQRLQSDRAHTAPIDLIEVTADGTTMWACAGVVARNSWWRGPLVAVMNVELLSGWSVAPAAHPNDGRLHVLSTGIDGASLSFTQRWAARRRLPTGAHVPHPAIALRRVANAEFRFERPMKLWLDAERVGTCHELCVAVVPDAAEIVF